MTCMNCGSAVSRLNGRCGVCDRPAAQPPGPDTPWPPLQPSRWTPQPLQPGQRTTPTQQGQRGQWTPQPQQPGQWTTPRHSAPEQASWSSPNAKWHSSEPSVEHARFIDPMSEPWGTAAQEAVVAAPQASWSGAPQATWQPPAWADEATAALPAPGHPVHADPGMDATVVNGFPAYQPPQLQQGLPAPYNTQPPPYVINTLSPYASAKRPGNPWSIAAFVLSAISVLAFPIFAGPVALILGVVALYRRERPAKFAVALGIIGPLAGIALSMLLFGN